MKKEREGRGGSSSISFSRSPRDSIPFRSPSARRRTRGAAGCSGFLGTSPRTSAAPRAVSGPLICSLVPNIPSGATHPPSDTLCRRVIQSRFYDVENGRPLLVTTIGTTTDPLERLCERTAVRFLLPPPVRAIFTKGSAARKRGFSFFFLQIKIASRANFTPRIELTSVSAYSIKRAFVAARRDD